jgi:CubicO group peptidase (beta-lactamase class C family)
VSSWEGEPVARSLAHALGTTSGAPVAGAGAGTADGALHVESWPTGNEAARFEIGSITKTMTGTVLAWLVVGGEVDAGSPVANWLDVAGTPSAAVTLERLATHTSGLPRLAPNAFTHTGFDPADPYAAFGAEEAVAGLRAVEELGEPGYSNFGFQLLGLCLERATGRSLADLFHDVLFEPLSLPTAVVLTPSGTPAPPWHNVLAGPGGVVADLADIVRYGLAVARPPTGRLGEAIRLATERGFGWVRRHDGVVWHNGGTAGCRSMLAIAPDAGRAVAAYVNVGGDDAVDQATLAALAGANPLDAVPVPIDDEAESVRWTVPAVAVAAALQDGDLAAVRAAMTDDVAAVLTIDRLAAARTNVIEPHLPLGQPTVGSVCRLGGAVQVRLHAGTAVVTTITFNGEARVIGLHLAGGAA